MTRRHSNAMTNADDRDVQNTTTLLNQLASSAEHSFNGNDARAESDVVHAMERLVTLSVEARNRVLFMAEQMFRDQKELDRHLRPIVAEHMERMVRDVVDRALEDEALTRAFAASIRESMDRMVADASKRAVKRLEEKLLRAIG